MTRPGMVLFDCDGVLVDSEPLTNRVLRDDLAAHGLDLPVSEILDLFVGGTMAGVMQQARSMGADLPDAWLPHIYDRIFTELAAKVELIPGVDAVLDALDAAGIGYAVGSNGPVAKMDVTLGRTGLLERFTGRIYSAHDCAAAKPAPDVYLKAAAEAGVAPDCCVVIEDSASGARAGQAAGMRCLGYCGEQAADKLRPYCEVTFDHMAHLPELLNL